MISLITGLPGSGKTSLMVYMLMTRDDLKNRPLYVDGIPELKIPTQEIPEGEDMTTWHNWAPTGAILVIDEAQRVFRPRPSGAKVPDYIQELETHRHKGIDIFLMTQHPRLIDVNLRSLIGEHRHISNTLLGVKRICYWQSCANPDSRSDIAEAKTSLFRIKKQAFGMYKSAEEHNKVGTKLSSMVYIFPIVLGILVFLVFYEKKRFDARVNSTPVVHQQAEAVAASMPLAQDSYNLNSPPPVSAQNQMPPLKASDFIPSIDGQPWTAPIYDSHNRNMQTMPYPVACVANADKCTCYTDQATPIRAIAKAQCLEWVEDGIYNPYLADEYGGNLGQPQFQQNESRPTVSSLGGSPLPSLRVGDSKAVAVIQ